jgi:chemotaxis protein MotB
MYAHTHRVLQLVAQVVHKMPQDIDITGHTDATRYQGRGDYSNWELSADRANAARRALVQFGVPEARISRVVGKAAIEPLIRNDPEAPGNRRLSVVLLRGTGARPPISSTTTKTGSTLVP